MKTQRRRRRGSRTACKAGTVDSVSGLTGRYVANCETAICSTIVAIC
jgi:hypothetical protein